MQVARDDLQQAVAETADGCGMGWQRLDRPQARACRRAMTPSGGPRLTPHAGADGLNCQVRRGPVIWRLGAPTAQEDVGAGHLRGALLLLVVEVAPVAQCCQAQPRQQPTKQHQCSLLRR